MSLPRPNRVAVIGGGPAGLMAASVLSQSGIPVDLIEKRPAIGRKILIAGSSGLNVSFDSDHESSLQNYSGPKERWNHWLSTFSPKDWLRFIESLGLETFLGTSKRYFVRGMKGASLVKNWSDLLQSRGVCIRVGHECTNFELTETNKIRLDFSHHPSQTYSAVLFALGGGSWESKEYPVQWPHFFIQKGIHFVPFQSANCGYQVQWPLRLLQEAEGAPLKNIQLSNHRGSRVGELVITRYGLEGTPIYALGESGMVWLDFKPQQTVEELLSKLQSHSQKLSPLRKIKKNLRLSPPALAILFHMTPPEILMDLEQLVQRLKKFPIMLGSPQPLEEAISSSGGISWSEINKNLMLKKYPGVFVAGEMLDWTAPTGGFLIQGCVSQGYAAGHEIQAWLEQKTTVVNPISSVYE